jgi:mercuric ion transport protein
MENEPKRPSLPIIAGGALMVACCLAPLFLVSAVASVTAWFGDLCIAETVALALFGAALVYGAIRLRNTKNAVGADKAAPTIEEEMAMTDGKLLGIGVGGTVIAAICCFTPVLVILLGAVGLAAWLAWLDYVLLPLLALFVVLTVHALIRRTRTRASEATTSTAE